MFHSHQFSSVQPSSLKGRKKGISGTGTMTSYSHTFSGLPWQRLFGSETILTSLLKEECLEKNFGQPATSLTHRSISILLYRRRNDSLQSRGLEKSWTSLPTTTMELGKKTTECERLFSLGSSVGRVLSSRVESRVQLDQRSFYVCLSDPPGVVH